MQDLSDVRWSKSSWSGAGNNCVEVADLPNGGRAVRDSKHPDGGHLTFTATEFAAFVAGVKSGKFDY